MGNLFVIEESKLNSVGIFIQSRSSKNPQNNPFLFFDPGEDYIVANGKEYRTNYASWNDKTISIWSENNELLKAQLFYRQFLN